MRRAVAMNIIAVITLTAVCQALAGTKIRFEDIDVAGDQSFVGAGRIVWNKYVPASYTLAAGTTASDIADLHAVGDGLAFHVDEAGGTPGIDLTLHFEGVTAFQWVSLIGSYSPGSSAHRILIQLYHWGTEAWITFDTLRQTEGDYRNHSFVVGMPVGLIGTGDDAGKARLRFFHDEAGNPSHDLDIDVAVLWQ